ncbi:MAG: hypothetical protein OXB84_08025, partial [Halobacteriovoraceae bacterium]|nr:hypothetical protein [Halobacteriovoraceae bacterium]
MTFQQEIEDSISHWCDRHFGEEKFTRGFHRISPLFAPLSREFKIRKTPIITIGGTNGKGETVFTLGYLLAKKNLSIGLWTSPHVLSIRERFVFIDQKNITVVGYEELRRQIKISFDKIQRKKMTPSYYEFFFFVFCELCLARKIDILVLEVGLGGRLDTVNLLDPHITALTSISRDHENILGRGYTSILREKLGITRSAIPLVSNLSSHFCREQVKKHCFSNRIDHYDLYDLDITKFSDDYSLQNKKLAFFIRNLFLKEKESLEEVDVMNFPDWPGRKPEMFWNNTRFIFQGGHNLDGIRKMMQHP